MAKLVDVCFEDIKYIVSKLSSTVEKGFGPSFQHTIVSTAAGNVLITNHGVQILKTLDMRQHIAKYIVDCVTGHYTSYGNDTKSFSVLLNEFITKSQRIVTSEGNPLLLSGGRYQETHADSAMCTKLANDITFALNETIPLLFHALDRFGFRTNLSKNCANLQQLGRLCSGAMKSHVHEYDAAHLSLLMAKFINNWHISCVNKTTMRCTVEFMMENKNFIFIEDAGKPVPASHLLPGYLISRGFCSLNLSPTSSQSKRCILLSCAIDTLISDDDDQLVSYGCTNQVYTFIEHKRSKTEQFFKQAKALGVSLIITSSQLSTVEKDVCRQYNIAAVHTVPEDELEFLSQVLNLDIIHDSRELVADCVCQLQSCEEHVLGMQSYLCIQPEHLPQRPSLIITGPTEGICRQTKLLLMDCLQIVRSALMSGQDLSYSG